MAKDSAAAGDTSGASFAATFTRHIKDMLASIGKMAVAGGSGG